MPLNSVLRHRGIEAWLEDSSGSMALSEDANIDSNNISPWVNVTPRQVSLFPPLEQSSLAIFFSIVLFT